MALPTGSGVLGGESASLMRRAGAVADDILPVASRHMRHRNDDDDSLKDTAIDVLKGGVETGDVLEPVDKLVNGVGMVAGVVGTASVINDFILRGTSWATRGLAKFKHTPFKQALTRIGDIADAPSKHFLDKPSRINFTDPEKAKAHNTAIDNNHEIAPESKQRHKVGNWGSDLFHASMVAESGVQTYHTGRSFFQKNKILKEIRDDMAADSAARGLRSSGDAAPLVDAGKHNYLEHGLRGVAALTGLALNFRGMRKGQLGMVEMFVPMLAGMGVDAFMGEHALIEAYRPFKSVQKSGHATAEDYARFIFKISKELNANGVRGQKAAMQMGAHYAAGKASAAHILNDMTQGVFQKQVKEALAGAAAAPPAARSHVDTLQNKKVIAGPVVGEHTAKLNRKAQLADDAAPHLSTPA